MSRETIRTVFAVCRFLPHLIVFLLYRRRNVLLEDVARWVFLHKCKVDLKPMELLIHAALLLARHPEFRTLSYYRIRHARGAGLINAIAAGLLAWLAQPMPTLYITTHEIGPGLYIEHGFATIISAKSMGRNCWVNQQVTIGFANKTDAPVIGDNVQIKAGAKVLGGVTIGEGSVVGANAVVVKDVPPRCTVVGVPAIVVRREGQRVRSITARAGAGAPQSVVN